MTGRSWRHFSVFLPFMVAGIIGPPQDVDAAPTQAGGRRRVPATRLPEAAAGVQAHANDAANSDGCVCVDDDELAIEDEPLEELPDADLATAARYLAVFKEMPVHNAVLELFCKASALEGLLFGDNVADITILTEAEVRRIEEHAEKLAVDYLQTLYGRTNTSKVHRLIYHLGDELRYRGNVWEEDTSQKETLHAACKRMYRRTNKRRPGVSL